MTRAVPFGRSTLGFIALGAACAAIVVPRASADPVSPTAPTTSATASPSTTATTAATPTASATPTTSATAPSTTTTTTVAPAATVADCSTATLAKTISSVTLQLSDYFAAHPDADSSLLDATRQPAFTAMSQFDNYFKEHLTRPTRCAVSRLRWPRSRTAAACRSRRPTRWPSSTASSPHPPNVSECVYPTEDFALELTFGRAGSRRVAPSGSRRRPPARALAC